MPILEEVTKYINIPDINFLINLLNLFLEKQRLDPNICDTLKMAKNSLLFLPLSGRI